MICRYLIHYPTIDRMGKSGTECKKWSGMEYKLFRYRNNSNYCLHYLLCFDTIYNLTGMYKMIDLCQYNQDMRFCRNQLNSPNTDLMDMKEPEMLNSWYFPNNCYKKY